MKVLKFVSGEAPYVAGDIATFQNDNDAQKYIDAKVARDITGKVKLPKKVEEDPESKDVQKAPQDKMINGAQTK